MANSVTIRTTAPGAKEAAADLDKVKTSTMGLGTTAKAAFVGIGVTAAAGFGLASKGALQAQEAQGKFMAATGQSREAAKQFVTGMDSLAGSAGAVGRSFDEIAQVGTTVAQQFGTTGQATTDLTENILEFSKVTGTNANDAANTLDDTLAAFNLTTADASPLMDELVKAQQDFGVSVKDGLPALQAMAPALDAMNASADDGVALLGAFEQGGIEAADAATALNKAVKTLKPGQDLNDLVTEISSIEDPTLRAQKAIEVFGKSGAKMAQVFKPGVDSLDQFTISATDAQGAVSDAANSMLTDADKIRGVADKIMAGAREVGQDFGPAITGLASLGTMAAPLGGVLGGVWKAAGASDIVKSAITTAAGENAAAYLAGLGPMAAIGLGLGAAIGGGIALGGSKAITDAAAGNNSPIGNAFHPWTLLGQKAGTDVGDAIGTAAVANTVTVMAGGMPGAFTAASGLWAHMGEIGGNAVGTAIGEAAVDATVDGMNEAANRNKNSLSLWGLVLQQQEADEAHAKDVFEHSAQAVTGSMADGLRSGKDDIKSAMDDLTYAIDHPMQLQKEKTQVEAALTSKKLLDGLSSNNPEIKAQAQQTQARLIAIWESLTGQVYTAADATSAGLANGLNNDYPRAVADAKAVAQSVNAWLDSIHNNVRVNINVNDPTGQGSTAHGHHAKGGHMAAGEPGIIGEEGDELWIPDTAGTVVPHGQFGMAGLSPLGNNQPSQIIVKVNLSMREVAAAQAHYAVVQRGAAAF